MLNLIENPIILSIYPLKDSKYLSAKQQASITFKYLLNDLWFHVKDMPGSHVVLKLKMKHLVVYLY